MQTIRRSIAACSAERSKATSSTHEREKADSNLCDPCNTYMDLWRGPKEAWPNAVVLPWSSWGEIQVASASNCAFCSKVNSRFLPTIQEDMRKGIPARVQQDTMFGIRGGSALLKFTGELELYVMPLGISWDSERWACVLEFSPLNGLNLESVDCANSYEYARSTGAASVASLVHEWLESCISQHQGCLQTFDYHPPRLLEIRPDQVRVIATDDSSSIGYKYATLSHCWGRNPQFLRLTSINERELHRGFSVSRLPRNFRDAVDFCRKISLEYIWIDSLCILQEGPGSAEDWQHHVTIMRRIYQEGVVNIAASRAANAEQGLYIERDPSDIKPSVVQLRRGEYWPQDKHFLLVEHWINRAGWYELPLNRRAWVYQERLFSPRVIHFGEKQVFWECRQKELCETYIAGTTVLLSASVPSFQLQQLTLPNRRNFLKILPSSYGQMVEDYSACDISFPAVGALSRVWALAFPLSCPLLTSKVLSDKLPAFSGIAEYYSQFLPGDQYLAGIFRSHLPYALLWQIDVLSESAHAQNDDSTFRCPSWSWAKSNTRVHTRVEHHGEEVLAHVIEAETTPLDPLNPFGRLLGGHLILSAILFPTVLAENWTILYEKKYDRNVVLIGKQKESYMVLDDITTSLSDTENAFIVPIIQRQESPWQDCISTYGLVVRRVDDDDDSRERYERMGVFVIATRQHYHVRLDGNQRNIMLI